MFFKDSLNGWAVGHTVNYVGSWNPSNGGIILGTTDGGYNWAPITEGFDFTASAWLNNATGWAGSFAQAGRTRPGIQETRETSGILLLQFGHIFRLHRSQWPVPFSQPEIQNL